MTTGSVPGGHRAQAALQAERLRRLRASLSQVHLVTSLSGPCLKGRPLVASLTMEPNHWQESGCLECACWQDFVRPQRCAAARSTSSHSRSAPDFLEELVGRSPPGSRRVLSAFQMLGKAPSRAASTYTRRGPPLREGKGGKKGRGKFRFPSRGIGGQHTPFLGGWSNICLLR